MTTSVITGSNNVIGDNTSIINSPNMANGVNNNLIGTAASPLSSMVNALGNNGGPTQTMSLQTGSPAINRVTSGLPGAAAPTTDQRCYTRPDTADAGAFEFNGVAAAPADTTPPDTTITGNPTNPSNSTSATFTFTGSDNVTPTGSLTFQCQIDGGDFSSCTSPRSYTSLANGSRTFQVRAVDQAGNTDPTPASYTWTVDTVAPAVSAPDLAPASDSGVSNTDNLTNVTLPTFTGTAEPGARVPVHAGSVVLGTGMADGSGNWTVTNTVAFPFDGCFTLHARAYDAAGNEGFSGFFCITIDTTAPTAGFNSAAPNPTNTSPIPVTVMFSESVTGFTAGDITTNNGTVSNFAGSGNSYTFDLVPSGQGLVTANIAMGVAQDTAGNPNTAAAQFSRTYDTVAPTVSFSSAAPNPTGNSPIPVTVMFSENVPGFTAGDIAISNGTVQNFAGSGNSYTLNLVPSGQGLVTANIAGGVAQDAAGNPNTAATQFSRTYDSVAPDTTITANLTNPSASANARFSFTGSDPGGSGVAGFQCQLDGGGFSSCTSPQTYTGLSDGSHTFQVRAIDATGNADPTPASFTWIIDTTAPDTTITANPTNPSGSTNASFSFTGSEPGGSGVASFQCQLDGGGFTNCTSPQTYTGLSLGSHTFQMRALDAAGNTDPTPASYTWSINAPPVITPTSLSRAAGTTTANLTIANANDTEDLEDQLRVQISTDGTNFFDTVSAGNVTITLVDQKGATPGLVNPTASGEVIASILMPCDATVGPLSLFLRVTDSGGQTDTKACTLTITPNPLPVLTYNFATVIAGTTPSFGPATGPSDNGVFGPITLTSITPATGLTLAVSPTTGAVTVTSALLVGNYNGVISVTDNCGATTNAQLIVTVVCPTITLGPASLPNATINTAYPQTITAAPAGGNYSFAVTSGSLPAGLTLNSNGSFSGAPTQSGVFNFRVTATGFAGPGGSCTAFQDYTLLVNCAGITVNPTSLPGGTVGTAYNQTVSASPAGTYSYAVSSGALPTGLTLNASTGAITGSPTTTGTFNFTITATAGACSGSRSYSVTFACATITLGPGSPLPGGQAGVAYNQAISASPSGAYTFSLATGSLPSGLTLNPTNGLLSGTPMTTGTFTFTVKAQTAGGCEAAQSYTLVITCPTVTLAPASLPTAATGAAYTQTISVSPSGGGFTYAVTSGSLPTGLNLNSSTGVLSGTPTAGGTFNFRVTATGFGGCTGFRDYTLVIGGGGCPTITLAASLPNGSVGQLYNAAATASPAGLYSYTVTGGSVPPWVTLFGANGLLFGYPTAVGGYTFTITATQGACSGNQSYTVLVGAGFASSLTVFSDFDGDGKSDLAVFRESDGNWLVANCGNGQLQTTPWGSSAAPYNDLTVSGDYDGDGKTDLAVFRRRGEYAGYWFIKQSSTGEVASHFWGLPTDLPVPGDYDADGKTDVAVWRASAGVWYIVRSSDGGQEGHLWGSALRADLPVPGDYDGDGSTDLAIFRRADGYWHIKRSSDGTTMSLKLGVGTDVAVPGDYDGDGLTDLAVWRALEGAWYILESSGAALQTVTLGAAGDVPVAADYDGDGKADAAVWQASTRTWRVKRSSDNAEESKAHGQTGDTPVMARKN